DVMIVATVDETQDDGIAVPGAKAGDGVVQMRHDLLPVRGGGFGRLRLHESLLLAVETADFRALEIRGGEAGGVEQPARKDGGSAERARLPGEDYKDRLGDFFRLMMIANPAHGHGIDHVDVAGHEFDEGWLGIASH